MESLAAVGVSDAVFVKPGQTLEYALAVASGESFVGVVQLEVSRSMGQTWNIARLPSDQSQMIFTGTAAAALEGDVASGTIKNEDTKPLLFRFNCTEIDEDSDAIVPSLGVQVIPGAAVSARFTIGAEDTENGVRAIGIQLIDADGNDINYVAAVMMGVFADANGNAFATGGSTGIAIGTDGALATIVAKKLFLLTSEADGDIDLTWTDIGAEGVYLGIIFADGRIVMSAKIQNA